MADWSTASDADWVMALQREAVLRPLAEQPRFAEPDIAEAASRLRLARVTIYRLVRRYRQRPQTSSLMPWKRGRTPSTRFLDKAREELIATCIKEFYMVR